ncbi:MAG: chemotaxis protein CheX [Alphaproteobacteria bacterium]|jgi:chemotaxis protein CheX|nr:chemotaxis protein CheX [Alphaproteobacteria bacterium]
MSSSPLPLTLNDTMAKGISLAVTRALRDTFGVDVTADAPEYGEGMVSLAGDVSGIIAMVQQQLEGTLMLSISFEVVRDLLPQVVGKSVTITPEMVGDTVGELTNMIFGQVKSELNQRGHQIKLGIPCVVTGKGHFVSQFHRGRYMIVPFRLDGHLFQVYVALHGGGA